MIFGIFRYFPTGIPHSIQGFEPDGAEFMLVFDDGDFDALPKEEVVIVPA